MQTGIRTGYAPYGAYAMKATYQRNLSLAMLSTVSLVGCAVLAGLLWPAPELSTTIIDGGGSGPIIIESKPIEILPESILRGRPPIEVSPPPAAPIVTGNIPVPVPDELFDGRVEIALPTRSDLAGMLRLGDGSGSGDPNGTAIDASGGVDFEIADPEEFVAMEIHPGLVHHYRGEYPRLAAKIGVEGVVGVYVLIDEEGKPLESRIAKSSGLGALDEAAAAWALQCRFTPGIQNGRPIKVWVSFSYEFQLE